STAPARNIAGSRASLRCRPVRSPAVPNRPCFPPRYFLVVGAGSRFADEIPRFEFNRRRVFLKRYADRIAARCQGLELLAQHPPDHQDAAIALAEMLFRMQRHGALADLGLVVTGELLVLLFGNVPPELAVEFGAHPSDVAGIPDAPRDVDSKGRIVDR